MALKRYEGLDLAVVGLIVNAGVAPSVLLILPSPARTIAVFAFAFAGVGTAVMCHVGASERAVSWALTVVLSLAVFGLAAAVMIWADYWHPKGLLFLAIPCALSCLARVVRAVLKDLRSA